MKNLSALHFFTVLLFLITTNGCSSQHVEKATLTEEIKLLEDREDDLRDELRRLEKLHSETLKFNQELQGVVEEAKQKQARRDLLVRVREEFKKWTQATLILGNENTSGLVAVRNENGADLCVAVADHPFKRYALDAIIHSAIPTRAEPGIEQLLNAARVHRRKGGQFPVLLSELATTVSSETLFAGGIRYLVFRNAITDMQQVAILREGSGESTVTAIGREIQSLADEALVSGSYARCDKIEMEEHLIEPGLPFLDFCALSISEVLQSPDFRRPMLAVSLVVSSTSATGTPARQPSDDARLRSYLPPSQRGYIARTAREALEFIENEIRGQMASRLIERKIPLLERHLEQLLKGEDQRPGYSSVTSHAIGATHQVRIEIVRGQEGIDVVSVRLVDLTTRSTIWIANDSKAKLPTTSWQKYALLDGTPSVVTCLEPVLLEQLLTYLRKSSEIQIGDDQGRIILAVGPEVEGKISLRALFSAEQIWVDASKFKWKPAEILSSKSKKKDVLTIPEDLCYRVPIPENSEVDLTSTFDGLTPQQYMHYMTWRIARHLAPPATSFIMPDDQQQTGSVHCSLPIDSNVGINISDRFRIYELPEDGLPPKPLPVAGVTQNLIGGESLQLYLPASPIWKKCSGKRMLAVCNSWPAKLCGIAKPIPRVLAHREYKGTADDSRRYLIFANEISGDLQSLVLQKMHSRIDTLPMDWSHYDAGKINESQTIDDAGRKGITHMLLPYIESDAAVKYRVRIVLQEIQPTSSNRWTYGKVVDSFQMTIVRGKL